MWEQGANGPDGPESEGNMNRRLINHTAFDMARVLAGKFGNGLGEEELRQMFEECFETCRQGLEAYCREENRMRHNLNPMEVRHVRA